MADFLLSREVSEVTLGKPALFWLPLAATVGEALKALEKRDKKEISVWSCKPHTHHSYSNDVDSALEGAIKGVDPCQRFRRGECQCVGKICMLDIICYLSTDESLNDPAKALHAPISDLIPKITRIVQHVDNDASLSEALELIVCGAQNLVVAIDSPHNNCNKHPMSTTNRIHQKSRHALRSAPPTQIPLHASHNSRDYCWLTLEDVIRFLLGFIGVFSPLPMMSIEDLGVIQTDVLMVETDKDAIFAVKMIQQASDQTAAVAVVQIDDDHAVKLIGEISSSSVQHCDETAALALATLSVGDFLIYNHDSQNPPDFLIEAIRTKLRQKKGLSHSEDRSLPTSGLSNSPLTHIHELEMWDESSDDESGSDSPTGPHDLSSRWFSEHRPSSGGFGPAKGRIAPIVCRPKSSLIAVMVQALTHRENYVWVTEEDSTLVGIVTFTGILSVLLNHLISSC